MGENLFGAPKKGIQLPLALTPCHHATVYRVKVISEYTEITYILYQDTKIPDRKKADTVSPYALNPTPPNS